MGSKSWPRHCGRSQLPERRRTPKRRGLCINPDVLYHAHCEHGNALTEYCGMCEFDALYGYPQKIERELARFRSGEISRQLLVQNLEQLGLSEDEIYSIDECKRAKAEEVEREDMG